MLKCAKWNETGYFKLLISVTAFALLLARFIRPSLPIDATSLGLLIVVLLPWCGTLIKSAKLPGGWEVTFRDVDKAGEKITGESFSSSLSSSSSFGADGEDAKQPSFLTVAEYDPSLAVVGLRIEIEKRLRRMAERCEIPPRRPLGQTLRTLVERGALDQRLASGLDDLIAAGNQAAHGASVEPNVAQWAVEVGPRVLAMLDREQCSDGDKGWS
jgi:hypothetical protein